MKELNEYKAEVFCRSEERIQKRIRTRNRVIAMCIPLCFAIVLCSVFVMQTPLYKNKENAKHGNVVGDSTSSTDNFGDFLHIEVVRQNGDTSSEYNGKITNTDRIETAYNTIKEFFKKSAIGSGNDEFKDFTTFVITFTAKDGSKSIYTLKGNVFLNNNTEEKINLTQEQLDEIKAILGLTE